ncbi:hypothetical protein [Streptomyces sp. NBC_00091]|uniref:hypothetical protein n=1 Tax=Streptomyces sp. NBC_00091 TaxID=2975648 RepID=UPI0022585278|nr:hypothetical protein [Streptomyces sp. NBC_00091]MCX5381259.1 hypothetical protein [Streptomyces sp. NBC_00091]
MNTTVLNLLHGGGEVASIGAALYAIAVTATAMVSVLARSPKRRSDARETLKVLLRRGPRT